MKNAPFKPTVYGSLERLILNMVKDIAHDYESTQSEAIMLLTTALDTVQGKQAIYKLLDKEIEDATKRARKIGMELPVIGSYQKRA